MRKFSFLVLVVAFGWSSGVSAATLNVVGGILHGASGVDVGGTFYNVEFVDGTCIELFTGCDDPSDFDFASQAEAVLAAQALLDQVFVDGVLGQFDSEPGLTNGCSNSFQCLAFMPYFVSFTSLTGAETVNYGVEAGLIDFVFDPSNRPQSMTSTPFSAFTVASWSAVPEPSTALLLGIGLAGLGMRRRRQ